MLLRITFMAATASACGRLPIAVARHRGSKLIAFSPWRVNRGPTGSGGTEPANRAGQGREANSRRGRTGRCGCPTGWRSEEHTSELQSRQYLGCRLLLETKKERYLPGPRFPTSTHIAADVSRSSGT